MTYGLEKYDVTRRVFIDVETISWDDHRGGLRPYHGDRVAMIVVGQEGAPTQAFPIRHRTSGSQCIPIDEFLPVFRVFLRSLHILANQNVKFDLRMMAQDDCFVSDTCRIEDTIVLARLVDNSLLSYSLEDLAIKYKCALKKKHLLEAYLANTKDYGAIPLDLLTTYAVGDVDTTQELYNKLYAMLPEETQGVWDTECKFAAMLFKLEHRGLHIDKSFLMKKRLKLLQDMIKLAQDIITTTKGKITNPGSVAQVAAFFLGEGVAPVAYNEPTEKMRLAGAIQGNASWNADALSLINHPVANLLVEYKELAIQESTFCAGWLAQVDDNGWIHPTINSAGTKTGRPSAKEPNIFNPPKWIMSAIKIPDGYVGVKWDKSQIEYRIFAHYANDEALLQSYADNPRVDYHQIAADKLGLPRDPVKTINFGVLYGMGQDKLKKSIAAKFGDMERSPKTTPESRAKLRAALRRYTALTVYKDKEEVVAGIPEFGPIPTKAFDYAAEAILAEYHRNIPSIKRLGKMIKSALQARGYIRNFFGRRYKYDLEVAYIAMNALIQGSAADFFKKKLVELFEKAPPVVFMENIIYDACFAVVPEQYAQQYWELSQKVVCDSPFKVPVLIDGEVAVGNWGNIKKIVDNDVMKTKELLCRGY